MAEKNNKTCQSTESVSDSGKNRSPKNSQISNLIEKRDCAVKEHKNSPLKVNKDKSKNCTKEEKSCGNEKTKERGNSPAKDTKLEPDDDIVIKEGFLTVHGKAPRKKSRLCYFRLLPASPSSRAHLQQFSKAESAKQKDYQPEHVILAHDVNRVVSLPEPEHAFLILYKDESIKLSAEDDFAQSTWIKAIRKVLLSENQATFADVKIPRSFDVYISKETQIRMGDGSQVELFIEHGSIAVIASKNIRLVRWPIAILRKFGFDADTFMVIAGRNSEHGEGVYRFITKQGEEIHRTVKAAKLKDPSFDGHLPGMGWQPSISENNSPPRPYLGFPQNTLFEGDYAEFSIYDPIYEPVGVMLQNPTLPKFPGPKAALPIKARHPTDPGSASRPGQQGIPTSSLPNTTSQRSNVKAATTASNGRAIVYDDVRLPWVDHSYKNIVTSETAFPIHPNIMVVPIEQPSSEESFYAEIDRSKKTNKKKDSGILLVPEHKKVTLPHDAKGYTIPRKSILES